VAIVDELKRQLEETVNKSREIKERFEILRAGLS